MSLAQRQRLMIEGQHSRVALFRNLAAILAWLMVILCALNTLYFIIRAANPLIEADGWYFLDVFVRKAIHGTLRFSDFFVKRNFDDHAQPLFKLLLLFNLHYFDLDFVLEAIVGLAAAVACTLIYYRLVIRESPPKSATSIRYLCWVTICALLFSLNSVGIWVWPIVSLENITTLIILVFILATWHAHRTRHYSMLAATAVLLGVSSDDSALIAAVATMGALCLALSRDPAQRHRETWKVFFLIGVCIGLVRIGYAFFPASYPTVQLSPITIVSELLQRFKEGGWWQWVLLPLALPVYYQNPLGSLHSEVWSVVQVVIAFSLFVVHLMFWRRAFRARYDLTVFTAVCMMLLTYGWIVGIILWRVPQNGNDYLLQPRYVLLYTGHLIALLLMWITSLEQPTEKDSWSRDFNIWIPTVGCLIMLALQLPQSLSAWRELNNEWAYYHQMAQEIDALSKDPTNDTDCGLIRPVCNWPPKTRKELTELLSDNRLNAYSPEIQRRHKYLPKLKPVSHESGTDTSSLGEGGAR